MDLALDAAALKEGRDAKLLELLLVTRRYKHGPKPFQLVVEVDLKNGGKPVPVEVEFLAPSEIRLKKTKSKRLEGSAFFKRTAAAPPPMHR